MNMGHLCEAMIHNQLFSTTKEHSKAIIIYKPISMVMKKYCKLQLEQNTTTLRDFIEINWILREGFTKIFIFTHTGSEWHLHPTSVKQRRICDQDLSSTSYLFGYVFEKPH